MASGGSSASVAEPATWSAYICPFLQEVANRQGGAAPRTLLQVFPRSNKRPVDPAEFERLVLKYAANLTPASITACLKASLGSNTNFRTRNPGRSRNTPVQQLLTGGVNTLGALMTACRGHPAPPLQQALIDVGGEGVLLEMLFRSIFAAEHPPGTQIQSPSGISTAVENSLRNEQQRVKEEAEMAAVMAASLAGSGAAAGGGGNSNVEILEGEGWACKACTFQNPEHQTACNMCGSAKTRRSRRSTRKQRSTRRQKGGAKQIQREERREALIQNVNNKPERTFYSGLNNISASPPMNSYGRFKEWNDKGWIVQPPPRMFPNLTKKRKHY
jgi:hypothetical protein